MAFDYDKWIRPGKLPHIWCPGCGHGIVMKGLIRAMETLKLEKKNTAIVSGIGCASRLPGYIDCCTLHTAHGRAAAFATGVKMAKPEMNVILVGGDGDGTAIGGNHFIHACRRNIDMTYIIMNNYIYGMTGGQFSPCYPDRPQGFHHPLRQPRSRFRYCQTGHRRRCHLCCPRNGLPRQPDRQTDRRSDPAQRLLRGRDSRRLPDHLWPPQQIQVGHRDDEPPERSCRSRQGRRKDDRRAA